MFGPGTPPIPPPGHPLGNPPADNPGPSNARHVYRRRPPTERPNKRAQDRQQTESTSADKYLVTARDDTQDPAKDEQQLNRVRDWIKSYILDDLDVADALSAFPDISLALIEGTLSCSSNGVHYYTSKLQSKFGGESNQYTVRKLKDKMTNEGYIEASNNRRLGKRMVQSDLTKKKLAEVQKVLDTDAMEDSNETLDNSNVSKNQTGANRHETSTFGAVHSIGSDLTRTKDKSDLQQNVSNSSDQILSRYMSSHSI